MFTACLSKHKCRERIHLVLSYHLWSRGKSQGYSPQAIAFPTKIMWVFQVILFLSLLSSVFAYHSSHNSF